MIDTEKAGCAFHIMDIHAHYGNFNTYNTPSSNADSLVAIMDRNGISQICIAPFVSLKADLSFGNELTFHAMKKYPGRILGHACVNPFDISGIGKELDKCFKTRGFHAIKLHSDYNGCSPQSPWYEAVFEYADEYSLTILWHCGASRAYLEKLASRYCNVSFVLAHYGGAWDGYSTDEILELVRDVDNIYTDTASSVAYNGAFDRLVEFVGDNKVLFGSDMVFLDAAFQLGRILYSDVPPASKQKILGGNFQRLLNRGKISTN